LLVVLLVAAPVQAGSGKQKFTVGKRVYRQLSRIHESVEAEKYEDALGLANDLQERPRLSDHERALIWQTLGFIYSALERLDDAASSFERCLVLEAMSKEALLNTQFNLGQVYMAATDYSKAIKVLEDWLTRVEHPLPQARYLLGAAYAQTEQPGKALSQIEQAIAAVGRPAESWLTLALSLYFDLERFEDSRDTLKRLIVMSPRRTYWLQLASVYGELRDEARALAVMELAYAAGHVTRNEELLHFSRLYVSQGIPFLGATVLDASMTQGSVKSDASTLEFLANAWIQARALERAVSPLGKAARVSGKGELFLRLAHLHVEREEWPEAVGALERVLQRGAIKHPGQVYLLKGIAHAALKQKEQARVAFELAGKHKTTRLSSLQWLKHLNEA